MYNKRKTVTKAAPFENTDNQMTAIELVAPSPNSRRIAYLCFHVAGRDVELPEFRRLGFQIFTIKTFNHANHRSGATDYTDDANLDIPSHVLKYLNTVNFIDNLEWPPLAVAYLNEYFDYIFVIQNAHIVYNALRYFNKTVIVRLAGLDAPKSYTGYWNQQNARILPLLRARQKDIWFSVQYENLSEIEDPVIVERSIYMPLGIPSYFEAHADTWTGERPYMISVIPWIHTPYYRTKYRRAKAFLQDRNLVIMGDQREKFTDPRIKGFLDMQAYVGEFQQARGLFYDSHEPRHVHYPPFEAVTIGLPVLFPRQSLLSRLGDPRLPGAFASMEEFRVKADRLLSGDQGFIQDVRQSQKSLNRAFEYDFVQSRWLEAFERIRASQSANPDSRSKVVHISSDDLSARGIPPALFVPDNIAETRRWTCDLALNGNSVGPAIMFVRWVGTAGASPLPAISIAIDNEAGELLHQYQNDNGDTTEIGQFWAVESSPLEPNEKGQKFKIRRLSCTAPDQPVSGWHIHDLRMMTGAFNVGEAISFRGKREGLSKLIVSGFVFSNPNGLDVSAREAMIAFASDEDTICTPNMALEMDVAHYDRQVSYSIVVLLNDQVIGYFPHDKFMGQVRLQLPPLSGRLNILRFHIQLPAARGSDAPLTAHISRLILLSNES